MKKYVFLICLYLLAFRFALYYHNPVFYKLNMFTDKADISENLLEKANFYRLNCQKYNFLFIGDSRTYTNIDPFTIDRKLGTSSFNAGMFAHWFPTQFSYYQDLVTCIPEKTIVVWSIGHQNFYPIANEQNSGNEVNTLYPIKLLNIPKYLNWGFSFKTIKKNIFYYTPLINIVSIKRNQRLTNLLNTQFSLFKKPIAEPVAVTENISSPIHSLNTKVTSENPAATVKFVHEDSLNSYINNLKYDTNYIEYRHITNDTIITSLILFDNRGSYNRVIFDTDFFNAMKSIYSKKHDLYDAEFVNKLPAPEYWNCFVAIIELFQKKGVKLIINEFEEAPFMYKSIKDRELYRNYMSSIKKYCRSKNIPYIKADFNNFTDEDYFDWNHMHSLSRVKYSEKLALCLQPYVKGFSNAVQ